MNIVDSLVVTLGLDSKNFVSGIEGSTNALSTFASKALSVFGISLGFEALVDYFKNIHEQLSQVGFESRNLGIAATQISQFGEVSKLMGGQVGDAAATIEGLQSSLFNLQFRGQVSDQLVMLQRFGVAYMTASGHMRNFKDIARDASRAVEAQGRINGMDQGQKTQLALSFGFQGGMATAIAQGGKELEKALAESADDQKALNEKMIQRQVELSKNLVRLDYSTSANSAAILDHLMPQILTLVTELRHLANEMLPKVVYAIEEVQAFFKNPPPWFQSIKDVFVHPPEWIKSIETYLGPTGSVVAELAALAIAVGAGSALVTGLIGLTTALALSPFKLGATAAKGAAGGLVGVAKGGIGWIPSIVIGTLVADAVEMALPDKWKDWFDNKSLLPWLEPFDKRSEDQKSALPAWLDDILKKYKSTLTGPNLVPPAAQQDAPPTPNAARPTPSAASASGAPTASNSAAGTNVHIDNITVNTKAQDAYAMASDLTDAFDRKFLVGNSDLGFA